ncbi:MAG: MerR family transcriptional regulator [Spirochaetales bacterium]|nr:MerR family transcriptional regulator [Spirochaetales bacterium]
MEYRIGDFALITRFSVKVLRNYHETGLLEPRRIDYITGYRYYDESQIERTRIIGQLKEWDFSLKEIREILDEYEEDRELIPIVLRKREEIRKRMEKLSRIEKDLTKLLKIEEESQKMEKNRDITVKEIGEKKIISITYRGAFSECGQYMGRLFKAARGSASGRVFNLYGQELDMDDPEVTVCLEVKKKVNSSDVENGVLPASRVLSLIHLGPYEMLGDSYRLLVDKREEMGLVQSGPYREIYIKGPGMIFRGNPRKYVTELQVPISPSES